jgi:hypothetical protein
MLLLCANLCQARRMSLKARNLGSPLQLRRARRSRCGAQKNNVPARTAFRWARQPNIRTSVESSRRRALDRAVGRMARHVTWATDGIANLAS